MCVQYLNDKQNRYSKVSQLSMNFTWPIRVVGITEQQQSAVEWRWVMGNKLKIEKGICCHFFFFLPSILYHLSNLLKNDYATTKKKGKKKWSVQFQQGLSNPSIFIFNFPYITFDQFRFTVGQSTLINGRGGERGKKKQKPKEQNYYIIKD